MNMLNAGEIREAAAPSIAGMVQQVAEADIVIVQGRVVKNRFGSCSEVALLIKDGVVEVMER